MPLSPRYPRSRWVATSTLLNARTRVRHARARVNVLYWINLHKKSLICIYRTLSSLKRSRAPTSHRVLFTKKKSIYKNSGTLLYGAVIYTVE